MDVPALAPGLRMAWCAWRITEPQREVAVLVCLQTIAAAIFAAPMLVAGGLVNDRLPTFYFFRDILHSLNVYGEFPWWNPSFWRGFPFYYAAFLYWPGRDPIVSLMAGAAWGLGRLGITIESYHFLFVVYITWIVPLLLSLSVFALAKQLLRRRLALYLVIALSVFSPGVVFSLSDFGIEMSVYGFFFAAALFHFTRRPSRSTFVLMCLPALALATATFTSLFWNLFFVPAAVAAICVGRGARTRRARQAFRDVPWTWWAAATVALTIYVVPSVVAYSHGGDILWVRAEGRPYYSYEELRPGTPLEALAISTPGIGFEWTDYDDPAAAWTPRAVSRTSGFTGFGYMGMVTLPLAVLGLVLGRPYWRVRLFIAIAGVLTVALLSAYSPILTLVVGLPTPLRGVNHHSDTVVRTGLFAIVAFAAGLGLEALLRGNAARRWAFAGATVATAVASLAWLAALQWGQASANYLFGLAVAFTFLYGVAVARFALARRPAEMRAAVVTILALLVVDTSAFAFAHLRLSLPSSAGRVRDPGSGVIGSVRGTSEERSFFLRGLNDPALLAEPAEPAALLRISDGTVLATWIPVTNRSYNGITFRADSPEPARLVWRDAYFPFWRASVNGAERPVIRSSDGMKAVDVPAGTSEIRFGFEPTGIKVAAGAAYLTLAMAVLLWLAARRADTPARILS